MMDFKQLSEKMEEMQDKMDKVEEKIGAMRVTRESGAGLVKATVSGGKRLVSLDVDERFVAKGEKGMVEDLIVAAVNLAMDEIEEKAASHKREASIDILQPLVN